MPLSIRPREQVLQLLDAHRRHALGALLELAGRLVAAQEQHGEHGLLGGVDLDRLVEQVAVLGRAAVWPEARRV